MNYNNRAVCLNLSSKFNPLLHRDWNVNLAQTQIIFLLNLENLIYLNIFW